jgi:phage portal protein BeeE
MRNERTNRRYGFSPVEQIRLTIMIGIRNQEFWAEWFRSGNLPEALCFLPDDLPPEKIKECQQWFDSELAGDLSKRRRLTFPPGFVTDGKSQASVQFTKDVLTEDRPTSS